MQYVSFPALGFITQNVSSFLRFSRDVVTASALDGYPGCHIAKSTICDLIADKKEAFDRRNKIPAESRAIALSNANMGILEETGKAVASTTLTMQDKEAEKVKGKMKASPITAAATENGKVATVSPALNDSGERAGADIGDAQALLSFADGARTSAASNPADNGVADVSTIVQNHPGGTDGDVNHRESSNKPIKPAAATLTTSASVAASTAAKTRGIDSGGAAAARAVNDTTGPAGTNRRVQSLSAATHGTKAIAAPEIDSPSFASFQAAAMAMPDGNLKEILYFALTDNALPGSAVPLLFQQLQQHHHQLRQQSYSLPSLQQSNLALLHFLPVAYLLAQTQIEQKDMLIKLLQAGRDSAQLADSREMKQAEDRESTAKDFMDTKLPATEDRTTAQGGQSNTASVAVSTKGKREAVFNFEDEHTNGNGNAKEEELATKSVCNLNYIVKKDDPALAEEYYSCDDIPDDNGLEEEEEEEGFAEMTANASSSTVLGNFWGSLMGTPPKRNLGAAEGGDHHVQKKRKTENV